MPGPGGVDTSSYPTFNGQGTQLTSPVDTISKLMGIQHQLNVNQQFQQEFAARRALGPIFQQSIDPQTGDVDLGKLSILGAADPNVAWKMPELVNQIIQRQNLQADTAVKENNLAREKYAGIAGVSMALVRQADEDAGGKFNPQGKPVQPGIDPKAYARGISDLVANGWLDAKEGASILAANKAMTPQQLYSHAKQTAWTARNIDTGLDAINGHIEKNNVGGRTIVTRESPATNTVIQPQGISSLEQTPTPAERNALVSGVDANGRPTQTPRSAIAPMTGGAGTPIDNTGKGGQSVVTGLSPQDAAALKGMGEDFVKYHGDLMSANENVTRTLMVMGEMKNALKDFRAGGGTEVREKVAQFAQAMGADQKLTDRLAGGDLGAIQEFNKLAIQYATSEMKTAMGSSQRFTNLDFGTFLKNNPTVNTDPRAIERMFNWINTRSMAIRQEASAMDLWKSGKRPVGYDNATLDRFPTWWANLMQKHLQEIEDQKAKK